MYRRTTTRDRPWHGSCGSSWHEDQGEGAETRRLPLIAVLAVAMLLMAGLLALQRADPVAQPSSSPTATATATASATLAATTASPVTPSPTPSPTPAGEPVPGVTTHTAGWRPTGPTAMVWEFSHTDSAAGSTLIAVPLDGGAPTRLVTIAGSSLPSVRRDGSAVAFIRSDGATSSGHLAIWDASSGQARLLGPSEAGTISSNPVWSPDGGSLYFGRSRPIGNRTQDEDLGLWHMRVDGTDLRRVVGPRTSDAPPTITIPRLVTDDGLLLWGRAYEGSSLEVLDLRSGRAASYGFGEIFDWRSEQPRALVGSCHLGCHGLTEWDDLTGSKREVFSQDVLAQGAAWEPGRDRIAVATFGPPWRLVLLQRDGSRQPVTGSEGAAWPHWVGDAIVHAWSAEASRQIPDPPTELRSISSAGGQPRTLYRVRGPGHSIHVIDIVG